MYKGQLSFIYENKKYVTLFGATEYLMSASQGLNNVAEANVIISSGGLSSAFKKLSGVRLQDIPVVDCSSITFENNTFTVSGQVKLVGEVLDVIIDGEGIHIKNADEALEGSAEEVQETETGAQQYIEGAELLEQADEAEESVTGVTFEEDISLTGKVLSDNEVGEMLELLEHDEQVNPVEQEYSEVGEVKDLEQAMEFVNVGTGQNTVYHSQTNPEELVEKFTESVEAVQNNDDQSAPKTDRFNPFARFEGMPVPKRGGIALAEKPLNNPTEFLIGGESNNDSGIYWDQIPYESNYDRIRRKKLEEAAKENDKVQASLQQRAAVNSVEARRCPTTEATSNVKSDHNKDATNTVSNRAETNNFIRKDVSSQPVKRPASMNVETPKGQEVLKYMGFKNQSKPEEVPSLEINPTGKSRNEVEAGLSPEIINALHNIPDSMLIGSIVAFTTKPIDEEQLLSRGPIYCMDNRWHRSGQWYCIDVVNDATRYFYNPKTRTNIAIPFNVCKEWVNSTP